MLTLKQIPEKIRVRAQNIYVGFRDMLLILSQENKFGKAYGKEE